ncbi:glycosyltransferase [Lysobacter ciconiae]|uniref:Glycosyltransferase n=1 Tax=Novilysobacter ciconiae TaxID=2781022 RepID=A0A7S6UEH9_9GAMM|nr:glycosyltransferase [Lysobacter ciconiae]QOW18795.1 glycosyltransferase [Lysobacter ciconiae]
MSAALVFWLCIGLTAYAYAGYPLLAAALARWIGRDPAASAHEPMAEDCWPSLTVVVAARNEEQRIAGRVRDILRQDYPGDRIRVHVVDDGSTDATALAAAIGDVRVCVQSLPRHLGKAAALNAAMADRDEMGGGLVVFTDARQRFAPGALRHLVAPFADASVGAVSGELVIQREGAGAGAEGLGLYWRMEKALRFHEARLGWLHGVSGAIHAIRPALFQPLPPGTVLDDMWLPLHVRLRGHRVWMARRALALDTPSADVREEFARKLRTLAGNWQLLARMPVLMHPLRNPVFLSWFSHKFLRLLVPWALLVALAASAVAGGALYRSLFALQVLGYLWAAIGLRLPALAARVPLLPAAGTFLMLNLAALLALPAFVAWQPSQLWKRH